MGRIAHNSRSKSVHATSTHVLVDGEMISLYHVASQGQTQSNKNFVHNIESLIGHSKQTEKSQELIMGSFLELGDELHEPLIVVCRENIKQTKKLREDAFNCQCEASHCKEEIRWSPS
jgi:hypothetical protein